MKTIFNFIARSSADPRKVSKSVYFFLLGLVPFFMQTTNVVCALGDVCINIDQSVLERLIGSISEFTFLSLTIISSVGFAWAVLRKIIRTIKGVNFAIK